MAVDDSPELLPIRRLHALVREVHAESKEGTKAARRLGISEGQVSKLLSGSRGGSLRTVVEVMDAMRLSAEFFFDPSLGEAPSYHPFVRGHDAPTARGPVPSGSVHWSRFLKTEWAGLLSPQQLEWVRSAPFRGGPQSVDDYISAAELVIRGDLPTLPEHENAPEPPGTVKPRR